MKALVFICLALTACSSSEDPEEMLDAGGGSGSGSNTNTGQRVVSCNGTLRTGEPSACPHDDCDETSANVVSCSDYASLIPGATSGLCAAGVTSSYALKFKKPGETDVFYEVVQCTSGVARLHACAFGYMTTSEGYGGGAGFVCTD